MKRLNVGCGRDIRKGWINLDMITYPGIDIIHNLNKYPYPFKNNTFDRIWASQIIEHLDDPYNFVKELWRIAKPGAEINIGTVHFSAPNVWGDLTHRRPFQSDSFNCFNTKYKDKNYFSLIDNSPEFFHVNSRIWFRYFFKPLRYIVNINRYTQLIYERWFSGIFRADGQSFDLEVIKNKKEAKINNPSRVVYENNKNYESRIKRKISKKELDELYNE